MAPPSVFKDNPPKRCERVEVGHGTEKELYKAWMTPGSHPRNQRAMFIQTSIVVSQRYRTLFDGSLHCTCGAPLIEFCVGSAFSATGDWILQVLTKEDGGRRYESARWRPPPRISGYETDGQQHWRTHIARRPSKMSW